MNIIEAIQAAENGAAITNHLLKASKLFLKYNGSGIFKRCIAVESGIIQNLNEDKILFSTAEILCNSWEIYKIDF